MKCRLDFIICPDELINKCYVRDAVRIKIVDPGAIFLTGILGESGHKMVRAGMEFLFTRRLAEKLIRMKIATKSVLSQSTGWDSIIGRDYDA